MKTAEYGIEITPRMLPRLLDAKAETQRILDKELRYSEDLQHKDTIERYRKHIAKLDEYIAAATV